MTNTPNPHTTIMLIDDDEDDRELFFEGLQEVDPSVKLLTAEDGIDAFINDHGKFARKKLTDKKVVTYTGYPGGKRVESPKSLLQRKPTYMLEEAIRGMLPKTRLGAAMYRKLHVYTGDKHEYAAQKPKPVQQPS
jgi:hypothetical protein